MIVTIDGPAGSGKSAAALLLAERLGIAHLDTGAMYRAMTLDMMEAGLEGCPERLEPRARELPLRFDWHTRPAEVYLGTRNVSQAIRTPEVTARIYHVADHPGVRAEMVRLQRAIAAELGSLVTEGRDQGTVVFPNTPYRFFLDADPRERARRRLAQLAAQGRPGDLQTILAQIEERDDRDRKRAIAPLMVPPGARRLDSSHLTLEQVVETLLSWIGEIR